MCRKRTKFLLGAAALIGALALGAPPTWAVDDAGLFELDGNAASPATPPPDDWQNINNVPVNTKAGGSISHTGVLADPAGTTIYTTGGSKDINDVSQWRF